MISYDEFAQRCVATRSDDALDTECEDLLKALVNHARSQTRIWGCHDVMWRAQVGCNERLGPVPYDSCDGLDRIADAYGPDRMVPDPNYTKETRLSRAGEVVFYAATDPATAVSEARPVLGETVSVG